MAKEKEMFNEGASVIAYTYFGSEKVVEGYLSSKYWFYRSKKYTRKYGNYTKEINLISGQFYFILLFYVFLFHFMFLFFLSFPFSYF